MDEKMKITLEKYVGDINDLDWSTEQIQAILSLLEEKEKNIEGLEATLYVEEETHLDLIRRAEKAETRIKELGIEFDGLHQIIEEQRIRIQGLTKGIEELIAYGMPKHIEEGLYKLIEGREENDSRFQQMQNSSRCRKDLEESESG